MLIETVAQTKFASVTFQVSTPDGSMFVNVLESVDGKPIAIQISIGKANVAVSTWANALARMTTLALEAGKTINDILHELSSLVTDRVRTLDNGEVVRSGPEGLMVALMRYRAVKYKELVGTLGRSDEHDDERGPRMGG